MAWIIQDGQLINDEFINSGSKPFVGDSPYTMWRIDPNANGGIPFTPLMIGIAKLPKERIEYLPITYKKEKLRFFMMLIGGTQSKDTNYV